MDKSQIKYRRGTEVFESIDELNPLLRYIAPENVDWEVRVDRLRIIHRDEWGAIPPRRKFYLHLPVRNVIFVYNTWPETCSSEKDCKLLMQDMQYFEMKKAGGPDVKYNFLVDNNGVVYEGRGFRISPIAPTKLFPLDDKSISIGFIGDHRVKFENESDIIPRRFWNAASPRGTTRLRTPVPNVVLIYYTGRRRCTTRSECKDVLFRLQTRHLRKEMDDIKYNFMIDDNGFVYEGRGWYTTTPVPTKYTPLTSKSITIAYVGDHALEQPNSSMIHSALKLIEIGISKNVITRRYDFVTYRADD